MCFVFLQQLRAQHKNNRWPHIILFIWLWCRRERMWWWIRQNQSPIMNLCCPGLLFVVWVSHSFAHHMGNGLGSNATSWSWIDSRSHIFRIYIEAHAQGIGNRMPMESHVGLIFIARYLSQLILVSQWVGPRLPFKDDGWSKVIIKCGVHTHQQKTHTFDSNDNAPSITIHSPTTFLNEWSQIPNFNANAEGEGVKVWMGNVMKRSQTWNEMTLMNSKPNWMRFSVMNLTFQILHVRFSSLSFFFLFFFLGGKCLQPGRPYCYCPPLSSHLWIK